MATLLRIIHPWIQKSIKEVEKFIEKRMVKQAKQYIHTAYKLLDAFELHVLA